MKKLAISISIGLLLLTSIVNTSIADNDWIIDGDTVYIDNTLLYASATPHTVTEDNEWVEFTFKSKVFSGDIDFAWGFDTTTIRPVQCQLWKNYTHYNNETGNQTYFDWIDFEDAVNHIEWNKFGMTDWYVMSDMPIQKDVEYKVRARLKIVSDTEEGKYWFVFKPSSESWVEAYDNGHLYYLDPWYGAIAAATTDSYEWDAADGRTETPDALVRLGTSNYYMVASDGTDNDGFLNVLEVYPTNGTIKKSCIDEWEFDITNGLWAGILHIADDIYAVYYQDTSNGVIFTTRAWASNGTLQKTMIDSETYTKPNVQHMIHVTGDIYALSYQELTGGYDHFLETYEITSAGAISARIDVVEYESGCAAAHPYVYPNLCMIDTDTVAIVMAEGSGGNGNLYTYNISAAGDITNTAADSWVFVANCHGAQIDNMYENTFVITYSDGAEDGHVSTVNITDEGRIIKALISTLEFDTTACYYPKHFVVESGLCYGVTYCGPDNDGFVKTFNISNTGTIGPVADSLEFDTGHTRYFSPIVHIQGNYYLIAYGGVDEDGWAKTIEITTPLPSPVAPPSNFAATTHNSTQINLSWTNTAGADKTYIEYNTTTVWPRGQGTMIYNNTGTTYAHTGLTHAMYYYQAYSYNVGGFNATNATANAMAFDAPTLGNSTSPDPRAYLNYTVTHPTGVDTVRIELHVWFLGDTWARGAGALRANTTELYFVDGSIGDNQRYFVRAWGFNNTYNKWTASSTVMNISTTLNNDPTLNESVPAPPAGGYIRYIHDFEMYMFHNSTHNHNVTMWISYKNDTGDRWNVSDITTTSNYTNPWVIAYNLPQYTPFYWNSSIAVPHDRWYNYIMVFNVSSRDIVNNTYYNKSAYSNFTTGWQGDYITGLGTGLYVNGGKNGTFRVKPFDVDHDRLKVAFETNATGAWVEFYNQTIDWNATYGYQWVSAEYPWEKNTTAYVRVDARQYNATNNYYLTNTYLDTIGFRMPSTYTPGWNSTGRSVAACFTHGYIEQATTFVAFNTYLRDYDNDVIWLEMWNWNKTIRFRHERLTNGTSGMYSSFAYDINTLISPVTGAGYTFDDYFEYHICVTDNVSWFNNTRAVYLGLYTAVPVSGTVGGGGSDDETPPAEAPNIQITEEGVIFGDIIIPWNVLLVIIAVIGIVAITDKKKTLKRL